MGTQRRSTARGRWIAARRKAREYAMVARALADTGHPVLAQIVPMRFCNLSCTYCNEYDKVSKPVDLQEMYRRIELDKVAGEALDILVNDRLVARGEAVVVNDKFGVRITDIVSQSERVARLR